MKKTTVAKEKANTPVETVPIYTKAISFETALKITYYLMAVDSKIKKSEEEKFDEICNSTNPDFIEMKEEIVEYCKSQIKKAKDKKDYFNAIKKGIEKELVNTEPTQNSFIAPYILVWNMLTIAYSDGDYSESERKIVEFVVKKTNIDKTLFLQMDSSYAAIVDIQKEIEWIKTTNKPYLVIEKQVKELEKRINDIFESVKYLMTL